MMKRKTLFTLLLLTSSFFAQIITTQFIPIAYGDGEEWLTGWTYRKEHNITGSSVGAQTDYPIEIKVLSEPQNFSTVIPDSVSGTWNRPKSIFRDNTLFVTAITDGVIQIRAIDNETNEYSDIVDIADPGVADEAYKAPIVGVLPNGSLIVLYDILTLVYKISTYSTAQIGANLTLLNYWGAEQTYGETKLYYPCVASFSDKLVLLFTLQTTQWTDVTVWSDTFDGETWTGKVKLQNHIEDGYYASLYQVGSYILVWGQARLNAPIAGISKNVYFTYSDDKGATWKHANGTAISLPMTEEHLVVLESHIVNLKGAILDEDNRPTIIYTFRDNPGDLLGDYNVKLAIYSEGIGASGGSWSSYNATDQDDNPLLSETYYEGVGIAMGGEGRPVIYMKEHTGANHYVRRYVRQTGSLVKFTLDTDASDTTGYSVPAGFDEDVMTVSCVTGDLDETETEVVMFHKPTGATTRDAVIRPAIIPSSEVYVSSVLDNFGDIRFTDSDGSTLLPLWNETKVDGEYATFWLNVPAIPARGSSPNYETIYIYYGNPIATTTSDISTTFTFGDEFSGSAEPPDGWDSTTIGTSTWSDLSSGGVYKVYNFQNDNSHFHGVEISQSASYPSTFEVRSRQIIICGPGSDTPQHNSQLNLSLSGVLKIGLGYSDGWTSNIGIITSAITGTASNTGYLHRSATYEFRIRNDGTNYVTSWKKDSASWVTQQTKAEATTVNQLTTFMIGGASLSASDPQTELDWIYVRKYVDPEPRNGAWGDEATEPNPPSNVDPTVTSFIISDLSDGETLFKTLWYRPVMVVDDADGLSTIGTSYFSFETDYGWHNVSYNYQTDVYAVETETGMIMVANGYTESSGTSLTINFYLYLLESIDVEDNVDIYCRVTDDSSGDSDWSLEQSDYFNILDYVEDVGGSGTTTPWTPGETPSEEPQEEWTDTDGDGIPDWDDPDMDGDDIPNEIDEDIDGDDIPNNLDPEPFIPYVKPSRPILLSFKTPSGVIINIINPMYYLKPYQEIIIPFLFLLLAIILYSIYRSRQKKSLDERVSNKITNLGGKMVKR